MKKLIFIAIVSLLSLAAYAQPYPLFPSVRVSPATPTESDTIYLEAVIAFDAFFRYDTSFFIQGDTINLYACYWYTMYSGGNPISNTIRFKIGNLSNGRYFVKYTVKGTQTTNDSSCNAYDRIGSYSKTFDVIPATGIKNVAGEDVFQISPNPATTQLTLTVNDVTPNTTLQLFTIQGQQITAPQNITQQHTQIDVSTLPAGLYFAVLQNSPLSLGEGAGVRSVRKFVKE